LNWVVRADGKAFVCGNEPGDGAGCRQRLAGRGRLALAAIRLPFSGKLLRAADR
jgi:hypothetical protein